MSKTEIVRHLIKQESMQIDELRNLQNKTLPELASKIEPLAQSMAALADDARQAMSEARQEAQTQAMSWERQHRTAVQSWKEAAEKITNVSGQLREQQSTAAQSWKEAVEGMAQAATFLRTQAQDTQDTRDMTKNLISMTWGAIAISAVALIIALSSAYGIWHKSKPTQTPQPMSESENKRLDFIERVASRLDKYLMRELYPHLNQKRQEEIQIMYKELGVKRKPEAPEPPKPSETN